MECSYTKAHSINDAFHKDESKNALIETDKYLELCQSQACSESLAVFSPLDLPPSMQEILHDLDGNSPHHKSSEAV